ncbi:integrase catalytic domain-containing protein [Trichonephila clavipes]|nr:integrase catalytic domain-containing protein [Trichonephila clavipes]
MLVNSVFGYIVTGNLDSINETKGHCGLIRDKNLNKILEKFWKVEKVEEPIVKNKERLICEEHYANTHFRSKEGKYVVSMPLKEEPSCLETKTLGVLWKPNLDCFLIKVKVSLDSSYTKRDVLSTIAKIFDPVGLMAPVNSKAKIFLQRLWRCKLEWNDLLPAEEYREWQQFLVSLENNINNIEIPRSILVAFPEVIEIHGFADASEQCYGAAVYCKSKNLKSETLVRLITSKSRVLPFKSLAIPRLELCAAVLL